MYIIPVGNLIVHAVCQRPLRIVAIRPLYHRLRLLFGVIVFAVCNVLHRKGGDVPRRNYHLGITFQILIGVIQTARTCRRKDYTIVFFLSYHRHKLKPYVVGCKRPCSL